MKKEYKVPNWDEFDGELFQDLVCDLLRRDGYAVEPSGIGPDGGIDAIATQQITFGYSNPEDFRWGVQCKFSRDEKKTIGPAAVGNILNIVNDERFKGKGMNGYFFATNVRLTTNLVGELRGINNSVPGFKTTFWDRSLLLDVLNKHWVVFAKYFGEKYAEVVPLDKQPTTLAIDALDKLIHKPDVTEAEICTFFTQMPNLLLPSQPPKNVLPQVMLSRVAHGPLMPDFLVLPKWTNQWTIVELRSPKARVVLGRSKRVRFSSEVHLGIAQLRVYRNYFEEQANRQKVETQLGVSIYRPRMVLIIGLNYNDLEPDLVIRLKDDMQWVEIYTYEELLDQLRAVKSER